jgi:hypothetical protein
MPTKQRLQEIKIALMEHEGADPDNTILVEAIDNTLTRILPRIKHTTGVTDDELSDLIGKPRPIVQAYVSGYLKEQLTVKVCDRLLALVERRAQELETLIRDILHAKEIADK